MGTVGEGEVAEDRLRRRGLEGVFTKLYRRNGARYLMLLIAALGAFVHVIVIPAYSATLFSYFRASSDEFLKTMLAFEVALVPASIGMAPIFRRRHAALQRWAAGARGGQSAVAAWQSAINDLPGTVGRIMAWFAVFCLPATIYVANLVDLSPTGTALYFVFLTFLIGGLGVVGYLAFEQALRPLVREAAVDLPEGFDPDRPAPSLGTKLSILLPTMSLYTGMIVAAVSTNSLGLEGRLAVTTGTAVLVTATVSVGLTAMLRRSVLGRLEDVRVAIRHVDAGDLDVRLPNLAGDELDEVGRSFNAMAAGLQERERLRAAFGSYVSPTVAARVATDGALLGGEKLDVTIMFLDIVGYTARFERSEPEDVVIELNEFFETVIPPIEARDGYPNKLLGDGLLAVFGAPIRREDHAQRGFDAACAIQAAIRERYGATLKVGIGLNSGPVVVGSIGGAGKLDFTVIGDVVNTAARVEALTRETGDPILITEATRQALTGERAVDPRGEVALKGKQDRIKVYATVG